MTTEPVMATEADSGLATVPRWAAIPMILAGGAAAIPTGYSFGIAVAEGMALTVVMTLFTTMLWWPLRRHRIAWKVTVSVFAIHLLFVFAIRWPTLERANKGILLVFLVDVFAVLALSDRLERRTRASRAMAGS
jgi:hypothetical protein